MKKLVILCLLFASCIKEASPENEDTAGRWGGRGVQLSVTEKSTYFEFDCANAELKSKLKTVGIEVVEQFGTYTYERGGPVKVDEKPDVHPAAFRGKIVKDSMFISITILDQKRADIPLKMKKDTQGLVFKCL